MPKTVAGCVFHCFSFFHLLSIYSIFLLSLYVSSPSSDSWGLEVFFTMDLTITCSGECRGYASSWRLDVATALAKMLLDVTISMYFYIFLYIVIFLMVPTVPFLKPASHHGIIRLDRDECVPPLANARSSLVLALQKRSIPLLRLIPTVTSYCIFVPNSDVLCAKIWRGRGGEDNSDEI